MGRKYPFLHEPDEQMNAMKAADVMDGQVDCIHPNPGNVGSFLTFLREARHGGYPLTQSDQDASLLGYVRVARVISVIEKQLELRAITPSTRVAFSKFLTHPPQDAVDLS